MPIISKDSIPVVRLNVTEFKRRYYRRDIEDLAKNLISEMMDLATLHTAPTFIQCHDKIFTYNPTRIRMDIPVRNSVGSVEFVQDLQSFLSSALQKDGDRFIDQLMHLTATPKHASDKLAVYNKCYNELVCRKVKLCDHNLHDLQSILSDCLQSGSMPVNMLRGVHHKAEQAVVPKLEMIIEYIRKDKPLPADLFGRFDAEELA